MRHPPHDAGRCCRVCHAIAVTSPITDSDVDPTSTFAAAYLRAADKPPPAHGDGQRSLVDHLQYDLARHRKNTGLWQLNESTGDWSGDNG